MTHSQTCSDTRHWLPQNNNLHSGTNHIMYKQFNFYSNMSMFILPFYQQTAIFKIRNKIIITYEYYSWNYYTENLYLFSINLVMFKDRVDIHKIIGR